MGGRSLTYAATLQILMLLSFTWVKIKSVFVKSNDITWSKDIKFGANRSYRAGDITWQYEQSDMWLGNWKNLILSHLWPKFEAYRSCGDIYFLFFHKTSIISAHDQKDMRLGKFGSDKFNAFSRSGGASYLYYDVTPGDHLIKGHLTL